MKKIIEQIALQTGGSHYPTVGGYLLEQSIELVVRQCAEVALLHNQPKIAEQILQKFELNLND